jgi:tRNA(Ile)-lysidine synthase
MKSKCVLAISGGMDSIALLDSLSKILPAKNLIVAHFNHKVRGPHSDKDEAFVRKISKKYKIKFISAKRTQNKIDENSLRNERRDFLIQVAKKNKAKVIFTAHHAQDQLETMLMRLFRGTNLQGLRGMKTLTFVQGVSFYKPFLRHTKKDIEKYVRKNNLPYVNDASNQEEKYFRNRVRKNIIPIFEEISKQFGGSQILYQNILNLSGDLSEAHEFIEKQIHKKFKEFCEVTQYWIKIPVKDFLKLSNFEQTALLQRCFKHLKLNPLLREQAIRLLESLHGQKNKTMTAQDTLLTQSCGYLYIQTKAQQTLLRPKAPTSLLYIIFAHQRPNHR